MAKVSLVERANKVLSPVLGHYSELEVEKGKGCYLIGKDGRKYLDFSAGIAVCSTGHCHPKVTAAAKKQIDLLIHACAGVAYYEPNIALAEKLKEITPQGLDMTFFTQSGSEAIETALKLAKYVTKRSGIVAFQGGFHGRTLGALSVTTSKKKYQEGYAPLLPNVHILPYPNCYTCETTTPCRFECFDEVKKGLEKIGPSKIAAMIVEPILGEGGYIFPPKEFLKGLETLAKTHKILLIFDEVQSGVGRTGKWFAAEHFGVTPDIMVLAKGLASGFPLGATIAREDLMKAWTTGAHGGTFGGNPVTCAASLATINVVQSEKLISNAATQGAYLKKELQKIKEEYPVIGEVRGLGLMIGVEFVKPQSKEPNSEVVKKICASCLKNGLILISCGVQDQVIRFIPPLIVKQEQVDAALAIFEKGLKNVGNS